jgi:hypothetical protein
MTAKRRLVPTAEVEQHIELLRRLNVPIGAIDIRGDGVTIHPPAESQGGGSAYDRWKAKDARRDQAAHRS